MPIPVPDTDLEYHLISFDKEGGERQVNGALPSDALARTLGADGDPITDIFFVAHGWKGDVPAAIKQCNRWIGAMGKMAADRAVVRELVPGFKPLIVGIHWPSQLWGDEDLPGEAEGQLLGSDAPDADSEKLANHFSDAIAATPRARDAIRTILEAAAEYQHEAELSRRVVRAYQAVAEEAQLWSDDALAVAQVGDGGWDPQTVFHEAIRAANEGRAVQERHNEEPGAPGVLGGNAAGDVVLSPLRQLSFWTMKKRARIVGETGVAKLIEKFRTARPTPRVHLMGHSFGCIVVSAATMAQQSGQPVDTLVLVQGALSLWAYAPQVEQTNETGYFNAIHAKKLVRGAIVTTLSEHDKAIGNLYPMAARLAGQGNLNNLPLYGGVGTFGLRGLEGGGEPIPIRGSDSPYDEFRRGGIYNINASSVIKNGGGLSGAHSDIAHPEVARVAWQAIACSMTE